MLRLARHVLGPLLLGVLLLGACGDDDEPTPDADRTGDTEGGDDDGDEVRVRFCDAYLDYLAQPTPAQLEAVVAAADDPEVDELAEIIGTDDRTGRVLAATSDLESIARTRCQAEWVGSAQGGGDTAGAAQAFFDALVAGDPIGARNVASANAIARFEPWAPIDADPDAGTPALVTIAERSFTMALGPETIAECQVEGGVVLACTLAR